MSVVFKWACMESVENNAIRGFQLKQYGTRETNVAAMEEPNVAAMEEFLGPKAGLDTRNTIR